MDLFSAIGGDLTWSFMVAVEPWLGRSGIELGAEWDEDRTAASSSPRGS
jgi:hypothetical protein